MRAIGMGKMKRIGSVAALAALGLALCTPAAVAQQVVNPNGLTDPLGGNWSPVSGPVASLGIDANGRWRVLTLDANGYLKIDCVTGCSGGGGGGSNAAAAAPGAAPSAGSVTAFTNAGGQTALVTPSVGLPTADILADVSLGTPADTPWVGTGSGTMPALLKAVYGALLANTAVNASFGAAGTSPATVTVGTSYAAGRSLQFNCTTGGMVTFVEDGTSVPWIVGVGTTEIVHVTTQVSSLGAAVCPAILVHY